MKVNHITKKNEDELSGFLLINKPIGPTSFNIVSQIRRTLSPKTMPREKKRRLKVGHAGTLDPLASGLLIVAVGKATKEIHKFVGLDKTYVTEITLGATTETYDAEAEPIPTPNITEPTKQEVESILKNFIGDHLQTPPIFSAKKQNGMRLYKLARQGKTIDINKHPITIHSIELMSYKYPTLQIKVNCSSGTYIRSLARDIGNQLKTGGYVSALQRTLIGNLKVTDALQYNDDKDRIIKSILTLP
jgi:tRNA pseudouridine55 synthase